VEELASLPAPPWSSGAPRSTAERRLYSVDGCVVAYALEGDSDLHVVLRGETGATIMQMVPARPTSSFRYLQRPVPVTVTGPLFMDKVHGQEGVAPNGAEIHPVLRFRRRAGSCH